MANKAFISNFENWRGLDMRQSPLTREKGTFPYINNWVLSKARSLRRRPGYDVFGQPNMCFRAMHNYSYSLPEGGNARKLIGLNMQPWELATGTITITPPGSEILLYTCMFNSSTSQVEFTLYDGATPYTLDGANTYVTGDKDLLYLVEKIAALSGFSISIDVPYARVNGTQVIAASAGTTTINVDSGHTVAIDEYLDVPDSGSGNPGRGWFYVYAVSGTTITVPKWAQHAVTIADETTLGPLACLVASLGVQSTVGTATTIKFHYWKPCKIPWTDEYRPVYVAASNIFPVNTLNLSNISIFTRPNATGDVGDMELDTRNEESYIDDQTNTDNKPCKFDSQNFYRLGIGIDIKTATDYSSGSIPDGTYSYKYLYKMRDQVGNIIRSLPYDAGSVTLSGGGRKVRLQGQAYVSTPEFFTCSKGAYVAGAQSGVNTITIDTNSTSGWSRPNIDVGDYVYFRESTVAPPRLTRRKVTAVVRSAASYTITIDGATVAVDDNEPISVNLTIEVYRTVDEGATYYLAGEYASPPYLDAVYDDISDSSLAAELDEIEPGYEPYFPPRAVCLCEHQGHLILSGDTNFPNTVYRSLPNSIEQFNAGTHAFDVPSTESGRVTSVASDTATKLAVFKDRSYYDVDGILSAGLFSLNPISELDLGVSSQSAVIRTPNGLIALGKGGMFEIREGRITNYHLELRPFFTEQNYSLDTSSGSWLPFLRTFRFGLVSDKFFSVDFSRETQFITTQTWPDLDDFGKWIEYDGLIVGFCRTGNCVVELRPIGDGDGVRPAVVVSQRYRDKLSDIDDTTMEIAPELLSAPAIKKAPVRLGAYSIYTPEEIADFMANTLSVFIYRDIKSGRLSDYSPDESLIMTYDTVSDVYDEQKLQTQATLGIGMRLTVASGNFASPHITGWELFTPTPYKPDDIK